MTNEESAAGAGMAELPLERIDYHARVSGLKANVMVSQLFGNKSDKPVEAIYVFPLPAEACVFSAELQIGNRKIVAELKERKQAKKEYDDARRAGHHAGLVEQERDNIFTMSVAGIEPGEKIGAIVRYAAPVMWQDGGGRFRVPLVVAPRFIPGVLIGKQAGGWSADTDEVPDASRITPRVVESVTYHANLRIDLRPGFNATVESPTHSAVIEEFEIGADETRELYLETLKPDRDVIVAYKNKDAMPAVIVDRQTFILRDGEKEEFLMIQLTPGVSAETTRPLDVIFVLDCSGSMQGVKLDGLKVVAEKAINRLKSLGRTVRVGIIIFGSAFNELVPLLEISKRHFKKLRELQNLGGTNLAAPLKFAMDKLLAKAGADHERCVVVVSDGQTASMLETYPAGVRVHTIGIDTAVDDAKLKTIARETNGASHWIYPGEDYDAAAGALVALASGPVVKDLQFKGLPDSAEVVGTANGILYSAESRTIIVKSKERLRGLLLTGECVDASRREWLVEAEKAAASEICALLWAKEKLRDVKKDDEKTAMSLKYGVCCSLTAFVAVSLKERPGQEPERVEVPVLLPHTWDYGAVFGVVAAGAGVPSGGYPVYAGGFPRHGQVRRLSGAMRGAVAFRGGGNISHLGGSSLHNEETLGFEHFASDEKLGAMCADADVSASAPPLPTDKALPKLDDVYGQLHKRVVLAIAQDIIERIERSEVEMLEILRSRFESELEIAREGGFAGWSENEKAELYLLLAKLAKYRVVYTVPDAIKQEPLDAAAHLVWEKARAQEQKK